jgi:alpha-glucoside transport system substrate-binding protein
MSRKLLPYFVLALILALLLAACGGGATETAEEAPVEETAAEEPAAEEPAAEEPAAEEPAEEVAEEEEAPAADTGLPDLGGREVTIAVENQYLPFNYIDPDTGEPAGWDYEVWDEICNLLNCVPVYIEASWEGMIQAVADGQFDAAADGITITEDRAEIVDFSDGYVAIEQRLLVRLDEDRIESIEDIVADESLVLGTQTGTTNYETATNYLPEDRIQAFEAFPFAVQALAAGDVDAVIIDETAGLGYQGENADQLKLVGPSMSSDQLGFIYPLGSDLVDPVNAAFVELKANGFLQEVNATHFGPDFDVTYDDLFPPEEAAEEAAEEVAEAGYLDRAYEGEFEGTTVEVLGVMVEEDGLKMEESLKPFIEATGIDVQYVGTKEFETQLNVRVDAGDAPDIADMPQPGLLANLARDGHVIDVSTFLSEEQLLETYIPSYLDMVTMDSPDGPIMAGVWHRVAPKSFVWYPKAKFEEAGYEVPETWDELVALTDTIASDGDPAWCIGIESGAATGWVATDWMENIMLRTTSLENYDQWVTGDLPFNSPEVKNAAETMSEIWLNEDYVYGGVPSIVSIFIGDSPVPMFEDPPGCWMHAQAPWITGFFGEGLEPGVDYDFFFMPPIDESLGKPVLLGGDSMAMFNDRPEVRALMEYFSKGEGVAEWVKLGGAISPHLDSSLDWYSTEIDRKVAETLLSADSVRFDASDLMPGEVGAGSFWKAMTDYVSGSVDLDTALQEIDDSWPSE